MNHKGTKTIYTKRLILRQFSIEDASDMFNNWASDDEVTKYLMWKSHKCIQDSKDYISFMQNGYATGKSYDWAIVNRETNQVIGSIGVVQINERAESMHIGYCIGKKWWHMGYTSEAFSSVIDYLFAEVNVNRIESRHDTDNPNSGKVMVKCGLKYEGTLRQSDYNNQGVCDASWYSILRNEHNE